MSNEMPTPINDCLETILNTTGSQAGELRFCWWTEDDGQQHAEVALIAGDAKADYSGPWPGV